MTGFSFSSGKNLKWWVFLSTSGGERFLEWRAIFLEHLWQWMRMVPHKTADREQEFWQSCVIENWGKKIQLGKL